MSEFNTHDVVRIALLNLLTSAKTGHNLSEAIRWAEQALLATAPAKEGE